MDVAGVTNEDRLLLNTVAILSVLRTRVNGVLVVQTTANGVTLDNLVAHPGGQGEEARKVEEDELTVRVETVREAAPGQS